MGENNQPKLTSLNEGYKPTTVQKGLQPGPVSNLGKPPSNSTSVQKPGK